VVSVFLVAAAVTITPAMGFLWYLLSRYEGFFEDARVFFTLMVGFFAGLVVAWMENQLFQFDSPMFVASAGAGTAFVMFVAGYALVEAMAKTVVLGFGKFKGRKDTPYYGASLGIGFGAMVALQAVALGFVQTKLLDHRPDGAWLVAFTVIVLSAAGTVLTAGATSVWIGKGSADGRLWRGLGLGALLTMPNLVALWFFRPAPAMLPALGAFAYGLGLVAFTQRRVLDRVVPPEIRDLVMKERRREERAKLREP
jgi:hypothetical protein